MTAPRPGRPARRVTIIDVATRAGVSRQTVTRALHDMPGISAATREKVLTAVEDLHYRPSRSGRALVRSEAPVLGLLVADLSNAFFSELAAALIRSAAQRDWSVIFAENAEPADGPDAVRSLEQRVDVLVGYSLAGATEPGRSTTPLVLLDAVPEVDPRHGRVVMDISGAAAELREHLRRVGARRPALIDHSALGPSPRARCLQEVLDGLGSAVPLLNIAGRGVPGHGAVDAVDAERGRMLDRLLESGEVDTLVAFNDKLAIELMMLLRARGVRVPEDLRVVGIDGLALGELVTPTLTTLASDAAMIADAAVELAVGIYDHSLPPGPEATRRRVPYRLVVRDSA